MTRKIESSRLIDTTAVDERPDIQTVAESDMERTASDEAFMHEPVKILVYPSTDHNATPYATVSVNGDTAVVFRNVPTVVKRKHVEVLARMVETRVSQDMTPNASGEITRASLRGAHGLVYPFQVLEDKNPRGAQWLANVLAERN